MIWCVEDDSGIRDIEMYALNSAGFDTKGFEDGLSIWEALKKEKARLTHILESAAPAALESMQGVIDNAAWIRVELDILREDINENGYTTLFQQSDKVPPYDKERVQVQQYDKLLKNYLACIKQLVSRLPDDGQSAAMDELQEFMQFRR